MGNAWDAEGEVLIDPTGRKQEAEQGSQGIGLRSCTGKARAARGFQMGDDIGTGGGIQVARSCIAESEGQEVAEAALMQFDSRGRANPR